MVSINNIGFSLTQCQVLIIQCAQLQASLGGLNDDDDDEVDDDCGRGRKVFFGDAIERRWCW